MKHDSKPPGALAAGLGPGVAQTMPYATPQVSAVEGPGLASGAPIPPYLQQIYWWAYVHPHAVRVFERQWLVNLILFGNFARLRNAALDELGASLPGRTLQVACVYGDLTVCLSERIAAHGCLDVVDVLPVQLSNLEKKLVAGARVALFHRDSAALGFVDGSYDRALLFFLLHEQPDDVRRRTLAEAFRVVRPGGKIVLVDYHQPARWHPLRRPMRTLLRQLEPYALDLWRTELRDYLPEGCAVAGCSKQTYFGGLYQKVVIVR